MTDPVRLHGYRYSVYNRIARLALHCKGVRYETAEVNPFAELSADYLRLHPFGLVPVLSHGTFSLFETGAITRYVDRAFDGPSLHPETPVGLARMDQLIAVIDHYGYWPMVRQVFAQSVFQPLDGQAPDTDEIASGLEKSSKVLAFLDGVADEGQILNGSAITLADCHLAPMMDYFVRAEEGKTALRAYHALSRWWDQVSELEMLKVTDPLPTRDN
ncbi:glutathione S-transferase family protein [Hoeflea prorocentri]|uniref:glutathione transferase n=1 Tax=Hoeflea prorocentri TaxID=1922333 RepID=A0A9X3UDD9_9HYPH|nr:glutathione S-transferase family protein [Hoeflea prorocentri]MCY6379231.1 glutathione S-transferase family protein [Hoeflea prorocentri]MDA5397032.1 glutathione S-transferase family protein [Hoeflea prorocentri]